MRVFTAAVAIALPVTAMATTLNDFTPRLVGLAGQCGNTYTSVQISGCSGSDFSSDGLCSAGCVKGLWAFTALVQTTCGTADFPTGADNIILAFLRGQGPSRLCPHNAITVPVSSNPSIASSKSTTFLTVPETTVAFTTTETSSEASSRPQTLNTPSATPSSTHTVATTAIRTATSYILESTSVVSTSPAPSSSGSSQNDGSGGGSPFDVSDGVAGLCLPTATTVLTVLLILVAAMR